MTDLFAARPVNPRPFVINRAHLRGAIWFAALAAFVLLPRPDHVGEPRYAAEIASR